MNKQPFYHRVTILFTATREITRDELTKLLQSIKSKDIVAGSIECEEVEAEPGDTADLL